MFNFRPSTVVKTKLYSYFTSTYIKLKRNNSILVYVEICILENISNGMSFMFDLNIVSFWNYQKRNSEALLIIEILQFFQAIIEE